jgi:hypothetical protein
MTTEITNNFVHHVFDPLTELFTPHQHPEPHPHQTPDHHPHPHPAKQNPAPSEPDETSTIEFTKIFNNLIIQPVEKPRSIFSLQWVHNLYKRSTSYVESHMISIILHSTMSYISSEFQNAVNSNSATKYIYKKLHFHRKIFTANSCSIMILHVFLPKANMLTRFMVAVGIHLVFDFSTNDR